MNSVIVTGGTTAFGRETVLYLARKGFLTFALASDPSQADSLETRARKEGLSNVRTLQMEISKREAIDSTIQKVCEETGPPFGLVVHPGTGLRGFFEDVSDEEFRTLFDGNVFDTMALIRALLPSMRMAQRGRIVMITSIAGLIGSVASSAYCASKFALEGFGESLNQEMLPFGIHVTLLEPGVTKALFWDVHRQTARGASDPTSPYHEWFRRLGVLTDRLVNTSTAKTEDLLEAIYHALMAPNPNLRHVVGRRARLVLRLRRYSPEMLFERAYFGGIVRRITGTGKG